MKDQETNHMSAGKFAWFAARDASLKSAVNASRFSDALKQKSQRMKLVLELVQSCDEVSITHCKKWIRVKVHSGFVKDSKNLRMLEQDWDAQGISKHHTRQGIIYHVA